MVTISVLLTTMNANIQRVVDELLPQLTDVEEVVISHQITDPSYKMPKYAFPKNVVYAPMNVKGHQKSRNNAIRHATKDVCILCDDDLNYVPNAMKTVRDAYKKYPKTGVITFQAIDEKGKEHGKIKTTRKHSAVSILSVTSWMITWKRKEVIKHNIWFDEQFGLGTKLTNGDENIFLKDCFDAGLVLRNVHKSIVIHPRESSGNMYRDDLIIARPVIFHRMYGFLGILLALAYFPFAHYKYYSKKYSFFRFIQLSLKGAFSKKPSRKNRTKL